MGTPSFLTPASLLSLPEASFLCHLVCAVTPHSGGWGGRPCPGVATASIAGSGPTPGSLGPSQGGRLGISEGSRSPNGNWTWPEGGVAQHAGLGQPEPSVFAPPERGPVPRSPEPRVPDPGAEGSAKASGRGSCPRRVPAGHSCARATLAHVPVARAGAAAPCGCLLLQDAPLCKRFLGVPTSSSDCRVQVAAVPSHSEACALGTPREAS